MNEAKWQEQLDTLRSQVERLSNERERYRALYLELLEKCRKLEAGLLGRKAERLAPNEAQLTLELLTSLVGQSAQADPDAPVDPDAAAEDAKTPVRGHTRSKPNGRKPLPEHLPRVDVEVLPPEVQQRGLDSFRRIGEEVSEVIERRPASLVVVRTIRGKFVAKVRDDQTPAVLCADPLELPIPRGLAGPGMLADTLVRRWLDHLPLHRLEGIYAREGLELARSTVCDWHEQLAELAAPLHEAMWADARKQPYLCIDATGVLVQAKERCHRAHFWVVVAPELHVMFGYSRRHDGKAVDGLLDDYKGYLVSDAHSVYEHLYKNGRIVEVSCWAHTRRYFFKSLSSDPERARHALALIGGLFRIERECQDASRQKKEAIRQRRSKPLVDKFLAWCDEQAPLVLDETPISKGITYARNQRQGLQRFLQDGRLPIHNNLSELQLRHEAVGRKNWLFVGSDEGGKANATFVTLLASCRLHRLEPWSYLRDLLCLLPSWPKHRVLELAPAYWSQTHPIPDVQKRLANNPFRTATLPDAAPPQSGSVLDR